MAPSTTRFLIDLGLADKIIAIDTNSYAYADSLPKDVKQFDMMVPDNEALVALEPDIVFTSGMSDAGGVDAFQSVRDAGICVADIPSSTSFAEIAEDMKFIGSAVGKVKMEKVVKATLPFYICMIVTLLLLTFIPEISSESMLQKRIRFFS